MEKKIIKSCNKVYVLKKEKKEKHFIQKPQYPGGPQAFKKFISDNLTYPKLALENKIEGTVRVRYEINFKGEVVKSKVLSKLGYGCDEEAQRLVGKLKFDIPKIRKKRVSFFKTTNIHFKLPTIKKDNPSISNQISYQYTETTKTNEGNGNYNYSIKI